MDKIKSIVSFFIDTYKKWSDDRAVRMAAALAYYGIFSVAPLLVIVTGIVGSIIEQYLGDLLGSPDLGAVLVQIVGEDVAELLAQMERSVVASTNVTSSLPLVTLISFGVLLWGASSIFKYMHEVLNMMWGVEPIVKGGLWVTVRRYVVSFAIIFLFGLLLIVYLLLSAVVSFILPIVIDVVPDALEILPDFRVIQIAQAVVLFVIVTLLFSALYKILPDVDMEWRDVLVGSVFTALLFGIGVFILGVYFTFYSNSLYGAAGSLVVLLLWFYYSAQIFLFGAEFTYMYATRYGSKIRPADYVENATVGNGSEEDGAKKLESPAVDQVPKEMEEDILEVPGLADGPQGSERS